ncbi:MAG: class I adenylate cyclase [Nitrospinota bacterium]|nr:class I adenylate cyclase [Nitrospinota bacterium]
MNASDFTRNRILWRSYCANRIDRAYEIDSRKARVAFSLVPFLLHHNHPSLPGFVRFEESLGGIYHYTPTSADLELARRHFPSFFYLPYGSGVSERDHDFDSILLMGSIGTVAQRSSSDYDYWVVVDLKNISDRKIDSIQAKLKLLEEWAAKSGVEAHLFLSDSDNVKNNDFGAADKESAGSSQPRALKEEFYRTAIHVAGKDPLWWLLPPRLSNRMYETKKALLLSEGGICEDEFVDLGNAEPITKGELYGALLWQLNKATISPHKAAIKMALIESFLSGGEGSSLPCESLKEIVQSQAGGNFLSDPYLLMIDYARNRYLAEGNQGAVKSLEQCFYLKSIDHTINLEEKEDEPEGYKETTLRQLLRFWGWKKENLEYVNDFECWNIAKSSELGNLMHDFILTTYRNIYTGLSVKADMGSQLSDEDKTILGRKLIVIYDKRNPDKIEFYKRVMNELENLEEITFSFTTDNLGKTRFQAYMGDVRAFIKGGDDASQFLLRQGPDPINIIMWLAVNGITTTSTYLYTEPEDDTPVAPKTLRQILGLTTSFFHKLNLLNIDRSELLAEAYVSRMLAMVNTFSDSGATEIEQVHLAYSTSWGEVFCHSYNAEDALDKIAQMARHAGDKFDMADRALFRLYAPDSARENRVASLFISRLAEKLPVGTFHTPISE